MGEGVKLTFKIKNRLSHLEIVSSKQFQRIAYLETIRCRALRELIGRLMHSERYLFISFLRTKSNGSDEQWHKRKIA